MDIYKILSITLILVGIVIFIFSFLMMTITYNKTGSGKYNFLSRFPFELNQFKRYNKATSLYLTLMIIASLIYLFGILFFILHDYFSIFIMLGIFYFIAILSFNLLFFIKLSNYRAHVLFAIIFFFSTLLVIIIEAILLSHNNPLTLSQTQGTVNIVILFLLIGFMLFILLNPSYKSWAKMVKVDAQTYNRPKYNYLSILEWGSFLSLMMSSIPLIISLL